MNPKKLTRAIHAALIGTSLLATAGAVSAQPVQDECVDLQGTPPGLYVTVNENQVYLIKDDKVIELDPGEAAYASETQLSCLRVPPRLLEWPCNTTEALARDMAQTYEVNDLPAVGGVSEVVRRYFEENRALAPKVEWMNGEIHGRFPAMDLEEIAGGAYWYLPGSDDPFASPKRPKTQIVSLFWATGQAVVDGNTLTALEIEHADGDIPVVFMFNRDNEVPVSFFGPDATLKQVSDAFFERGIELAPVPAWFAGDHHLKVSVQELRSLFELPDLEDIGAERQAAIRRELEAHGFFYKPLAVSAMAENGSMVLDRPDVAVVAADMGLDALPVVLNFFNSTSHLADCGISMPQISVVGGATSASELGQPGLPPAVPIPPQLPDPERNPSDS